jgi:hypothetical protein
VDLGAHTHAGQPEPALVVGDGLSTGCVHVGGLDRPAGAGVGHATRDLTDRLRGGRERKQCRGPEREAQREEEETEDE